MRNIIGPVQVVSGGTREPVSRGCASRWRSGHPYALRVARRSIRAMRSQAGKAGSLARWRPRSSAQPRHIATGRGPRDAARTPPGLRRPPPGRCGRCRLHHAVLESRLVAVGRGLSGDPGGWRRRAVGPLRHSRESGIQGTRLQRLPLDPRCRLTMSHKQFWAQRCRGTAAGDDLRDTAKIALFAAKRPRRPGTVARHFSRLCDKFVTYRINRILPPINELERPYQPRPGEA